MIDREITHGEFAITAVAIQANRMGWAAHEFLRDHITSIIGGYNRGGWYARKTENGIHYFKWCKHNNIPSNEYLEALEKDGWEVI